MKNVNKPLDAVSLLKEEMGRGWIKGLMEKTGFSRTYIVNAVNTLRPDAPIWDAVAELKKEHAQFLKANTRKIKKAIPAKALLSA